MKVPKPRKMTSGNWYINLRLGGQSINVTEPTERACIHAAELIKAEYLAGKRAKKPEPEATLSCTLTDAIDHYIANKKNILSPATIRNYRGFQRTRFQAHMQANIWECDETYWQKAVNAEAPSCSAKTLKNAWGVMSAAIFAETRQRVKVRLPQVIRNEHLWLRPAQLETFINAIHGRSYEIPSLLALCSLRRSEIKALRWEDIDLQHKLIYVRGSMVVDESERLVRIDTNKNSQSRRTVPMIPQLADALLACEKHEPSDPVVRLSYNAIFSGINRTCRNHGLPEVGIQGLRHSFASLAYHLDIPEKIAMQIGGWADMATMHKIYTHIAQEDALAAGTEIQAYFENMQTKKQTDSKNPQNT